MEMNCILNGQAHGSVASRLMAADFNVNALRPFIGRDGNTYITVNRNGKPEAVPISNTAATLRKDEWIQLDTAVLKAAKPRLKVINELRGRGLTYNIPNGMGKTVLQTETQSDISEATVSMDGLRESEKDRPVYDITNLPLPIIHKDFQFSARQVATSRNGNTPLDTTSAELAGRRVAELAEQLVLGVGSPLLYKYAGGTIYGLKNFTSGNPKSLTDPTDTDWTPATLVQEILEMRLQSQTAYYYGPWMIYHSPNWDVYMDDDYSAQKGDLTLRDRIKKIEGILGVETVDYLTNYDLIMVQLTPEVIRLVIGMDVTTVQWEEKGGMLLNFKVMCIIVPQLRADYNGNCGLVVGSVA